MTIDAKFTKTNKYIDSLTDLDKFTKAVLLKSISRDDDAFFLALQADGEQLRSARKFSSRFSCKAFDDVGIPSSVLSRYVQNSTTTQ